MDPNIPNIIFIFVLAIFVGIEVISKVPSMLHTPLMSGTNAIHGIILFGGILVLADAATPLTQALGLSFENGIDHVSTVLEWGVRALGKPATLRTDSDLSASATADLFPAYDDDGGLLLVLTPSR